jgi:hypothetical protein
MNTSNLCQLAFILPTPSALESPARKALDASAQSDFFWLLISTAFVAVGIAFEYPEVKHEFIEWLASRKKAWVVDPVPTSRNKVPLWSLIGFIIVTAGVAGEGIYEGLLGMNDTKIRNMDEASISASELETATLRVEAESQRALADCTEKQLLELERAALPRRINISRVASKPGSLRGLNVGIAALSDSEAAQLMPQIREAITAAGWTGTGIGAGGNLQILLDHPGIWIVAIPPNEGPQEARGLRARYLARVAGRLQKALSEEDGMAVEVRKYSDLEAGAYPFIAQPDAVDIFIGSRPVPELKQIDISKSTSSNPCPTK